MGTTLVGMVRVNNISEYARILPIAVTFHDGTVRIHCSACDEASAVLVNLDDTGNGQRMAKLLMHVLIEADHSDAAPSDPWPDAPLAEAV